MFRKAASRLAGGTVGYVGCVALHNTAYPLHVVWDLDETLISSERIDNKWRADQANQILRLSSTECEHVDDDALHFISTIRPNAAQVLKVLHALPGCRQSVSTAASKGYAANVVQLLEEATGAQLFDKIEADQPSKGKSLSIFSPLRRGVLVDNRQSCHSTQPGNGIWVPDFDASARVLELSGGTYALGGAYAVRASKQARTARWPLEPRLFSGAVVGGGTAFDSNGDATSKPRMKTRKTLAALRRRRTEEENEVADRLAVRHKLLVAAFADDDSKRRRNARIRELVARAKKDGGAALLVVDPKNVKVARVPSDIDFPVVTAGSAAALAVANPHARNHDPRTTVTSAQLVPPRDDVLVSVLYRLLLCWLVPDVRWVLPGVEERFGSAPSPNRVPGIQ